MNTKLATISDRTSVSLRSRYNVKRTCFCQYHQYLHFFEEVGTLHAMASRVNMGELPPCCEASGSSTASWVNFGTKTSLVFSGFCCINGWLFIMFIQGLFWALAGLGSEKKSRRKRNGPTVACRLRPNSLASKNRERERGRERARTLKPGQLDNFGTSKMEEAWNVTHPSYSQVGMVDQ